MIRVVDGRLEEPRAVADAPNNDKSWWATLPGILTAIAAIITAVGGLIAILFQTGQLSRPGASMQATSTSASEAPATGNLATPARQREGPAPVPPDPQPAKAKVAMPAVPAKGVVVTHRDETVTILDAGATVGSESSLLLSTGQWVRHDVMKSIDFGPDKDWDGTATIALVDGQTMKVKLGSMQYGVIGKNKLGPFESGFRGIRSIEFRR